MVEKSVTTMVIKVDLQCQKCYKKIKKVLCEFPQIRDQVYDEKKNTVTIKVVCCSPEKIKQKICCKGGESVKGIEIIVPKSPPPAVDKPTGSGGAKPKDQAPKETENAASHQLVPVETPPTGVCCTKCSEGRGDGPCYCRNRFPSPPPAEKPTETAKPKESPKKTEPDPSHSPLVPLSDSPLGVCCTECSEGRGGGPGYSGYGLPQPEANKPTETAKPKKPEPAPCYPPVLVPVAVAAYPVGVCCTECSQGRGGGPCYRGCGLPQPEANKPCTETAKPKKPEPAPCYPPIPVPVAALPIGVCCTECSQGRGGGPCYCGYGCPPPRFYEGYCGRPVYDSWGCGYRYRDGYYVCEENASACSIM